MAASKRLGLGPECAIRQLGQPMLTVPGMVSTVPTPGPVALHNERLLCVRIGLGAAPSG